ncbi:MAG: demethoxyubiquinone hydroxylase family protein [Steroidobacteraceae bacterium]|jgi:demethoxyubiquinone hydroxylase (CLK1/Coq7/Cat5 family)|nr:demethoxyubiquinone hydroxylase family protein [Steroidobacteraceae bacterium]
MGSVEDGCTVYYDGACPLCSREIAHYQARAGADSIRWVDVARADAGALGADLERDAALARLHVRDADGRLVSGAAAFAAIWRRLPAYAWLARLASPPPVQWLLEGGYRGFLAVRRLWRPAPSALPAAVLADLRTDHAGETGAVEIYRGILAVTRDPALRAFATRHLATERSHLAQIEVWLAPVHRSRLLFLWRPAGWLTGALPALCGPRAVYATIHAVETFVDRHYAGQVARLDGQPNLAPLRDLLEGCRRDEVAHRDEAAPSAAAAPGAVLRTWARVVGAGSAAAVRVCRRL